MFVTAVKALFILFTKISSTPSTSDAPLQLLPRSGHPPLMTASDSTGSDAFLVPRILTAMCAWLRKPLSVLQCPFSALRLPHERSGRREIMIQFMHYLHNSAGHRGPHMCCSSGAPAGATRSPHKPAQQPNQRKWPLEKTQGSQARFHKHPPLMIQFSTTKCEPHPLSHDMLGLARPAGLPKVCSLLAGMVVSLSLRPRGA